MPKESDLDALGIDLVLDLLQESLLQLELEVRADHLVERPALALAQLADGVGEVLEQDVLEPLQEGVAALQLTARADHAEEQLLGVGDLHREVAEHHRVAHHLRHVVGDRAQRAAELDVRDLAGGDEVDLGDEQVAAGRLLEQRGEEGDVLGVEGVGAAGAQLALDLALVDEDRHLVGLAGQLRHHPDVVLRVLVDDVSLGFVGPGDEVALGLVGDGTEDPHCVLSLAIALSGES
ncbi:MAG: hypothetical protein QM765_52665 [Myxococcales bacterium]